MLDFKKILNWPTWRYSKHLYPSSLFPSHKLTNLLLMLNLVGYLFTHNVNFTFLCCFYMAPPHFCSLVSLYTSFCTLFSTSVSSYCSTSPLCIFHFRSFVQLASTYRNVLPVLFTSALSVTSFKLLRDHLVTSCN